MYKVLVNSLIVFFVVLMFYQIYLNNSRVFESFEGSSDAIGILNSQIKDINVDITAMKKDIVNLS